MKWKQNMKFSIQLYFGSIYDSLFEILVFDKVRK